MSYQQEVHNDQAVRQRRPALLHAATALGTTTHQGVSNEHAYHQQTQPFTPAVLEDLRPGFMRRVTGTVSRVIAGQQAVVINRHELSPYQPSYWTDYTHLSTLLRIWDAMGDVAYDNDHSGSRARDAKIAATVRRIARAFPELSHGRISLTREWVEHVLGQNLRFQPRRPHHLEELSMAASSGLSKGWGPW